jgi:hypothetical protein
MTAHSDVVLSGPDRPLVPAAPPDHIVKPLVQALGALRNKQGHWKDCGHRQWLGGWNRDKRHRGGLDCPDRACDGEGQPCSARCRAASRALAQAEAWLERAEHRLSQDSLLLAENAS